MSDISFLHRSLGGTAGLDLEQDLKEQAPSLLVWKTCRRQILFFENDLTEKFETHEGDQFFSGPEAEEFLAEILCGLQSPLIGETEVFGQFKAWWKALPEDLFWKRQHRQQIESLFSLVKSVREQVLCGSGSQSYGSLLRRFLPSNLPVDLIGAGHLVQELLPWIQNKKSYRIWCRTPSKIDFAHQASAVLGMVQLQAVQDCVVIAAPLSHDELNAWLRIRQFTERHHLFDLRADSMDFVPFVKPNTHYTLQDFSSRKDGFQQEIAELVNRSRNLIGRWSQERQTKSQIRPYGWDDL
jgi:glutamyl-tRNA reductase